MSRSVDELIEVVPAAVNVTPVVATVCAATLAIDGVADPPPQPAASSPNPSAARARLKRYAPLRGTPSGKQPSLKQP